MNDINLPSPVIELLRQLTPHSNDLKWTVNGRRTKVSLTLIWDCRPPKKSSFWSKIQRLINGQIRARSLPGTPIRQKYQSCYDTTSLYTLNSDEPIFSFDSEMENLNGAVVNECLNACERILNNDEI